MNRRGFLTSILALGAAPAIVRADALMRVVPVDFRVIVPITEVVVCHTLPGNPDAHWLDAIKREALRVAQEGYSFTRTARAETNCFYDAYRDSTFVRNSVFFEGHVQRKPPADTIRIRLPNRYTVSGA